MLGDDKEILAANAEGFVFEVEGRQAVKQAANRQFKYSIPQL